MIWQSNTKDEGVKVIKKIFTRIDYLDLTASEKQNVYDRYVLEGILKLDWISLLVFICEFILPMYHEERKGNAFTLWGIQMPPESSAQNSFSYA